MTRRYWVGMSLLLTGLACGGLGSGSPEAAALCELSAKELDCPCTTYAAGDTGTIDGFDIQVLGAWEEEDGVFVTIEARNGTVVINDFYMVIGLRDNGGVFHGVNPRRHQATTKKYGKGWMDLWASPKIRAGGSQKAVLHFKVEPEFRSQSLLQIMKKERKPDPSDPRGRMRTFTIEHGIYDLPPFEKPPEETPPG